MTEDRWTDDGVCRGCGKHFNAHHEEGQGRMKCPILHEESVTPPQEHSRSPRADY